MQRKRRTYKTRICTDSHGLLSLCSLWPLWQIPFLVLAIVGLAGLCTVIGQATEEPVRTPAFAGAGSASAQAEVTVPPESLKFDQFYKKYISVKGPAHSQLRQSP